MMIGIYNKLHLNSFTSVPITYNIKGIIQGPLKQMDGISNEMLIFQKNIMQATLGISKVMKIS